MIFTSCPTCFDAGTIMRPEKVVERTIWRDGQKVFLTEKTGGVDACPLCAAQARVHWEQLIAE